MAAFPIKVFRVAERSMEPSIKEGSYVMVWIWAHRFKHGDIVVLRHPAKDMLIIKRIKRINGGKAYVIGDNSVESDDSRRFGEVSVKRIIGRVLLAI